MNKETKIFLNKKANYIRNEIIRVAIPNKAGHIAPSLSTVDILTALYYDRMSYKLNNPLWSNRDRLILSKSHGCYALYAILADIGFIPKDEWNNFNIKGKSTLHGCVERKLKYGLESGSGSLGHGLPMATGLAFGAQLQKKKYYTFCVTGDGELEEGTTWEAIQFGVKHKIKNLIIIVDNNHLGAMDFLVNIMDKSTRDLFKRLKGFGLDPLICPGHDVVKLANYIKKAQFSKEEKPKLIIANTIKGFGLKCMENIPKFHYRIPKLKDLKMGKSYE
jgi:transketolase